MINIDRNIVKSNGESFTLNDEQFDALNSIINWIFNNNYNDKFYTLSGYAGTGKTTIIKKIIDNYDKRVCVSAPTHIAKNVIKNLTGSEGVTLHSLLGLRPDISLDDFNPNDPKFNPIALSTINDYDLIIIDESSMINLELYNLIKTKSKYTKNKIIFIGDEAQIPPINEKMSMVFLDNTIPKYKLYKVERQLSDNPLMSIYDKIRDNLNNEYGGYDRVSKLNDNNEGIIFCTDKDKYRDYIIDKFTSDDFKNDYNFCKIIAWRNVTIMKSNKIVRDILFNTDSIIEIGDLLMGYRTISNSNYIPLIENSSSYKVNYKSELKCNDYGLYGYNLEIIEINTDKKHNKSKRIFIVDSNDSNNIIKYSEMHDDLIVRARNNKKKWKEYYTFRRDNIILVNIDKFKNGKYRESHEIINKDMDYGYAITCHKSQGSTYSHVFILENDIDLNKKIYERNQIKYVALTRPRKTAIVLTYIN